MAEEEAEVWEEEVEEPKDIRAIFSLTREKLPEEFSASFDGSLKEGEEEEREVEEKDEWAVEDKMKEEEKELDEGVEMKEHKSLLVTPHNSSTSRQSVD